MATTKQPELGVSGPFVTLMDTKTGWACTVATGDGTAYLWSEGNYSCDCNRYDFVYADGTDHECGDERFIIVATNVSGLDLESEDAPRV